MATIDKSWMVFVDGKNPTIRAQAHADKRGINLSDSSYFTFYKKDT